MAHCTRPSITKWNRGIRVRGWLAPAHRRSVHCGHRWL